MTFNPNVPQPGDLLSKSQNDLLNNNSALNSVFGIDHFSFSNATANSGFHQKVTTPAIGAVPATTTNPIFYAFSPYAQIGVIHYSRGPSNAVPTPLTTLQSSSSPISLSPLASTPVLSTAGITTIYGIAVGTNADTSAGLQQQIAIVTYNAGTFIISNIFNSNFRFQGSGTDLALFNNTALTFNNVYWTLQILRVV